MKFLRKSIVLWLTILCLIFPLSAETWEQTGIASWYGGIFQGRLTANGETYNTYGLTCAHKTLPFGTILVVTHLGNNKTVHVRVNDRGPFVENRIIDLTYAAAKKLDMIRKGTARVHLKVEEGAMPDVRFNIRIGAWRDFENVKQQKQVLEKSGFKPVASMNNTGITRLSINNVDEEDIFSTVLRLKKLGYSGLVVSQISE